MVGIYGIVNKIDKRIYIGQSIRIKRRWKRHYRELEKNIHPNSHLQRAWNKYGKNNFVFQILEECLISELNDKETFWFKFYEPNTYNIRETGIVQKISEETKIKISNSLKGHPSSLKGKRLTEEHKRKIAKSSKGKPGTRNGMKNSEEQNKKISLANKGNEKCHNSGSFQKGHLYHSHEIKKEVL